MRPCEVGIDMGGKGLKATSEEHDGEKALLVLDGKKSKIRGMGRVVGEVGIERTTGMTRIRYDLGWILKRVHCKVGRVCLNIGVKSRVRPSTGENTTTVLTRRRTLTNGKKWGHKGGEGLQISSENWGERGHGN